MNKLDSRGFVEQLIFSNQTNALYKKVLASDNIQSSLSVAALKQGVKHSNEQIRLTAYQILDKKATNLNRQIQQLEDLAQGQGVEDQSNTWLQIASNYCRKRNEWRLWLLNAQWHWVCQLRRPCHIERKPRFSHVISKRLLSQLIEWMRLTKSIHR